MPTTMLSLGLLTLSFSAQALAATNGLTGMELSLLGPQALNYNRVMLAKSSQQSNQKKRADDFPSFNFTQPLDHFGGEFANETWGQRYFVSTRHFNASSDTPPVVVVLDGGETSVTDRLPYLDTGIVDILTKAVGGVGIILEHRYYGTSIPVQNFSTDALRFLNNDQAAADSANFMQKVNLTNVGIDQDLTAPGTKWIYYGGSYAGARSAHMKVLYPDIVYGAIASSGVTEAIIDYWQYLDTIRLAMNQTCEANLEGSILTIDDMLSSNSSAQQIKSLFALGGLSSNADFASMLIWPLGGWQSKNWDPAVGDNSFDEFCDAVNAPPGNNSELTTLKYGDDKRKVNSSIGEIDFALANFANYVNTSIVDGCDDVEDCFGTQNDTKYQQDDITQDWRLWQFQVCTQWGFYQGAPPAGTPRIVSNLVDVAYNSKICKQAYPPGQFFTVPNQPNITAVNSLGGFDIAADRLAIIDGEVDPWRAATPHNQYGNATDRDDTTEQPFKLIPGAVHHWDENGLADPSAEPSEIQTIHSQEIEFVKAWLAES